MPKTLEEQQGSCVFSTSGCVLFALGVSPRTHVCPNCGYVAGRDLNASINILRLGLSTVGHTGIYATGDLPTWAVGVGLPSNGESMNVESAN